MIKLSQPAHALLVTLVDKGSQNRPIGDARAAFELQSRQLATYEHIDDKTIDAKATQLGRGFRALERSKSLQKEGVS